jgi:hypothetical protein
LKKVYVATHILQLKTLALGREDGMIGDQCEMQVTEEVSGADHFKDGVRTITLSTWEEFRNAIGPYEKSGRYIWRG